MTRKEYKHRMSALVLAIFKAPTPTIPGIDPPKKRVIYGKFIRRMCDNIDACKYDGDMSYEDMWNLQKDLRNKYGLD